MTETETDINELGLDSRAWKCMCKLGINTIEKLTEHSSKQLLECRNFGRISLEKLRVSLARRGLNLCGEGVSHDDKLSWMALWAAKKGLQLALEGEVGFGRPCVGVVASGHYPSYHWYDKDYNRIDENGDVWIPDGAYHKGPYVAVLGRGEKAESELYDWLKWFDREGFHLEVNNKDVDPALGAVAYLLGQHKEVRLVR